LRTAVHELSPARVWLRIEGLNDALVGLEADRVGVSVVVKGADGNAVDLRDIAQWLRRPGFGGGAERNAASNPLRTLN
jgi:hypothetical protein